MSAERDSDTFHKCASWKICQKSISGLRCHNSPGLMPVVNRAPKDVRHVHIGPPSTDIHAHTYLERYQSLLMVCVGLHVEGSGYLTTVCGVQ